MQVSAWMNTKAIAELRFRGGVVLCDSSCLTLKVEGVAAWAGVILKDEW